MLVSQIIPRDRCVVATHASNTCNTNTCIVLYGALQVRITSVITTHYVYCNDNFWLPSHIRIHNHATTPQPSTAYSLLLGPVSLKQLI